MLDTFLRAPSWEASPDDYAPLLVKQKIGSMFGPETTGGKAVEARFKTWETVRSGNLHKQLFCTGIFRVEPLRQPVPTVV